MKNPFRNIPQLSVAASLIGIGLFASVALNQAQAAIKQSMHDGTCTDEATGKALTCPERLTEHSTINSQTEQAFRHEWHKASDKIFDAISSGEARFVDGSPQLNAFHNTFTNYFQISQQWDKDLAKIKTWQRTNPASAAAKFVESQYWTSYAWNARGTAYASEVRPESWVLFRERLAKARAALDAVGPQAKKYPSWYLLKIYLANTSGTDAEARAIFDEGIAQHPKFYPLYIAMAAAYEPKWGGSLALFDAFATDAVKLAKGYEGRAMYSRIYWSVDNTHGTPFLSQAKKIPNWKKLNAGFADLHKLYPKSDKILNKYTSVACRSNDGALYRKLRTELGPYLDEKFFQIVSVDVCDRKHKWQAPSK
jgi:hypothetical protein